MSKKKAEGGRMKAEEHKPITLIVTIYPPKKDKRRIVVSAAPEGEMPLIIDGLFPDRHALMDRAFGLVLRRDPQVVTVKEKTYKPGERHDEDKGQDLDEHVGGEDGDAGTDQLVGEDQPSPPAPLPESGEGSGTAELSDISSTEELPTIEGDESADTLSDDEKLDLLEKEEDERG